MPVPLPCTRRRRLAAVVALASLVILAACGTSDNVAGTGTGASGSGTGWTAITTPPGAVAGKRITPPINVADVTFTDYASDPQGVPFPLRARPGSLLVVYFGYLSCPDICPTTMSDISNAVKRLSPEDRARVDVAFVTIDPERDTGPKIAGYIDHFLPDGGGHALVAPDSSTLWTTTSRIGVEYKVDAHQPGDTRYGVAHTGFQYLVDDQGRVVWVWPYGTPGKDLAASLAALLHEVPTVVQGPPGTSSVTPSIAP